ncbi:sulfotransferase family 2 domain-containing protein [Sulfitobacter sp. F26169L]|uniref:sulfotransferase family 2 domain-containing protein n=1 Tax=Sulfitobacter sp. F26169L TaxID=2996015 RepID=UPI002260B66A|nr:sulfotransferase family 2 domain-containing protein [Sulfitobacter sp. F26169L]MCX7568269.1 sulfotransferase family 2 domain-containing protein [Sulfitobacter sp. F26169L]
MILNDKYRFVFVHIPKTAGTSVRNALAALDGRNTEAVAQTKHETPMEFFAHFDERTGSSANLEDIKSYRFVCFLRHPVDRFVSLHRYLVTTHRHVYPQVPRSINRFSDVAADRPDWSTAIRALRPQVDFVRGVHPWIGRFEQLEQDFSALCEMLDTDLELQHLNASAGSEAGKDGKSWNMRKLLGRIKRMRRSSDVAPDPITAQSRRKLETLYADDMERFGY